MSPISQRFAIPKKEADFEELCLEVLKRYWSRPGLEIFGKRGERQFGIDILDVGGEMPLYAAQCKLKEEHKNLPPKEIQDEVDAAKQFTPPLGKYAILTTAKLSALAQRRVRDINESHKSAGLFEVELLTWEHLCSLLQDYPDVQERFYGGIALARASKIEVQLVAINDGVQSLVSRNEGDEIDSLINEARDYIVRKEYQTATLLLNRIQLSKGSKLTPRQKFRVLSNHGATALGSGKPLVAANFFLEAASQQPDDEQGKTNEVLAYLLVDDLFSCHTKATSLRRQFPASSRLAALWLTSAPKEMSLSTLVCEIDSVLRANSEVCVALARRALMDLAFDKAHEYATSASQGAPTWSQPRLVMAQICLGTVHHRQLGLPAGGGSQKSLLLEAEVAASGALDLARQEKDTQTEKMALVLRADARLALGNTDGASTDAEEAQKLDPDDPRVMVVLAQARFAAGRIDDRISILKKLYSVHPDSNIAQMYGSALHDRGQAGDLDAAISAFFQVKLQDISPVVRPTLVTEVLKCLAEKKDWACAEAYLSQASEFLDAIVLSVIRGYLAHYEGHSRKAEAHALEAQALISKCHDPHTKVYLARLLMLTGKPADAWPLWQELFEEESPILNPREILNCAMRLRRDDLVMQTCNQLRARGVSDWDLFELEISYLEKYKIESAIERLQGFIAQHPEHKLARLRLSMIGLRLNRANLVHGKPDDLPSVDDLPLDYVRPVVQVMKYGGNPNAAVEYAYRYLRAHFNKIEAHEALMISMMPGISAPDIPPALEVVGAGAAVCYREVHQDGVTWAVLEDTDRPSGDFEEITLTSPLAAELSGKRVGDTVVIAKGFVKDRCATIVQILPKYVRRFQDSMGEMQVRFGAASSVESVYVGQAGDGNPQQGLEVIQASVEKRAAAVAGARDAYSSLPTSLHWFGNCFGKNAYEALMTLVAEEQQIKCCSGSSEERDQGLQALKSAKSVVVDITALATLRLLGVENVLSSSKIHFIISERTWVAFQEMLFEARVHSAPGGTLLYKDGQHMYRAETAEEKARRIEEDTQFVKFIERVAEIRGAIGLAAIEPEKREALEKFFGPYGAESIVLACDPEYVLWTDDLIQARLSAHEFGTRRVWTQLVLGFLMNSGELTSDEYSEASAKLLGINFVATLFDSSTVLAAIKLARWSVETGAAASIIKIFSDPVSDLQRLMQIFVEFIISLYRETVSSETRCSVTRRFLDIFAARGAIVLLQNLRKMTGRLFGVNVVGRAQFEQCFDSWLKDRDNPPIQSIVIVGH